MNKTLMKVMLVLCALLSFAHNANAADEEKWFDDKLKIRKEVNVTPGAKGIELDKAEASFPFALRLSEQTLAFKELKKDGADLRITGPDGNRVEHYVESIDAQFGLAVVWVKGVNFDPASVQKYHIYYNGDVKSVANSASVFDPTEMLFIDFTRDAKDRTSNGNSSVTPLQTVAGFAGQSANMNNTPFKIANSTSLTRPVGAPFTLSLWIKATQKRDAVLLDHGQGLSLSVLDGNLVARLGSSRISSITPMEIGAWTHVAMVGTAENGGKVELYQGGKLVASGAGVAPELASDISVGDSFIGQIDNLRYSSVARSASYINAIAKSDEGRALVSFGPEVERKGGASASYFMIIIKNLTIEGWVTIGLCGLMLMVAIWVMVTKSGFVSTIENQNVLFNVAYNNAPGVAHTDLHVASLKYKESNLAQLYSAGIHEVEIASKGRLTNAAIESLKARLDGVLSNQAYALSDRMVFLTLAISGGPFLGLLGTVTGVMITFAAIAAEGNVNVNAIAPGVAAALLATAAGLFVAIPALFGYNIILTRIKRINAASRSYADTLIARLSQQYGV